MDGGEWDDFFPVDRGKGMADGAQEDSSNVVNFKEKGVILPGTSNVNIMCIRSLRNIELGL